MDLALEGRHLWQFNWNFRDTAGIRFPYPIYPLVAPEASTQSIGRGGPRIGPPRRLHRQFTCSSLRIRSKIVSVHITIQHDLR